MAKRPSEHTNAQGKYRKHHQQCAIAGCNATDLQTHHIVDYSYQGTANSSNFVVLCRKHHNMVHDGKIDIISIL